MEIFKRSIFDEIIKYLPTRDVVVLHGARQVGKTYLLYYLKKYLEERGEKTVYLDLEDSRLTRIMDAGVPEFLKFLKEEGFGQVSPVGEKPRIYVLVDEIQYLKEPSSFLKITADHYPGLKLIVSGSSSFDIKTKFKDSLVGRTVNFDVFNLSFKEFAVFKRYPFDETISVTKKKEEELKELFREYARFGGYPRIVLTPDVAMKEKYLQQIIDTYVRKDIRDLAEVRDIEKFNKLLEILASQSGQLLNVTELAGTCALAKATVGKYLFLLEQTYILHLVRPHHANLRSELFKTPKVFFYDTGLMQMLWLKELPKVLLGPVLETSVFAELVKKYGTESIRYWRTTDKKEIDFVLRKRDQRLPIEVKTHFLQFKPQAVDAFLRQYRVKDYRVVGLEGPRDQDHFRYPWQV